MELSKNFEVDRVREECVAVASREETLIGLFPDAKIEVVESTEARRTICSHYTALGREGTAVFHFDYLASGDIGFAKVCDGNVWRELSGRLEFTALGARTRVTLTMRGQTKGFVPEFTIKGPLRDQLEEMATALRERIEID